MDAHDGEGIPPKDRETALLLCVFLGHVGAHRFYAGRIKTGIAMTVVSALGSWLLFTILLFAGDRGFSAATSVVFSVGIGLLMLAVSPMLFLSVFIPLMMVLPPAFASAMGLVVGMTFSWAHEGLQHFIGYAPVIGWVLAWFAWWLVDLVRICRGRFTGGQGRALGKAT